MKRGGTRSRLLRFLSPGIVMVGVLAAGLVGAEIPPPAEHLGFAPGSDGRLADWDALMRYYEALAASSDRVEVRRLGESTLDRPFLLVTISSPENLARAGRLKEVARILADPGETPMPAAAVAELASEGVAVAAVTLGLHASEVAACQMGPLLAYRLATGEDADTRRVLDNVVLLLFPSFNPDGLDMLAGWNDKTVGTPFEGSRYPALYHHYAGHDNNRDAYAFNLAESRLVSRVLYQEWFPQAFLDIHQMGSYGARLYIPPYLDPIHPNVDPMLWWEHMFLGGSMAVAVEAAGVTGVEAGGPYYGWWMPSFHMITNYHNIAGILTETASCRLASPLYIHPHQLQGGHRGRPFYGPQRFFANPWPGGWWRLSELVHQQEVSTWAMLDNMARHKEVWLRNMALKAGRNIERGKSEGPAAFVIPAVQHDPGTVVKLIDALMFAGVKVARAQESFVAGGRAFAPGDFVISLAQPLRAYVKSLLERIDYPDNEFTRRRDGSPQRPYDLTAFTIAEHMGVAAYPVDEPVTAGLDSLAEPPQRRGEVMWTGEGTPEGWLLSHNTNDTFLLTNQLLEDGKPAFWLREPLSAAGRKWGPGTVWVPSGGRGTTPDTMAELIAPLGVGAVGVGVAPEGAAFHLHAPRLGVYRRYLGGNSDEGWTRLLLDRWGFPYRRVEAKEVRDGALDDLDVFLVADDRLETLIMEEPEEGRSEEFPDPFYPPEYVDGLKKEGVEKLREFVRGGGTLILLDSSAELATEKLGIPVENAVAGLASSEFYCPGSTVWLDFDTSHPLAYGMPPRALAVNWASPVFAIERSSLNDQIATVATYPDARVLESGWLVGEKHLAGKAALVEVAYGKGRVVLVGFRAQLRAQTHGTFKVLFNALLYGAAESVELPSQGHMR